MIGSTRTPAVTTIAVQRFDTDADQQPHWSRYEIALPPHQTVLDALLTIGDGLDPTLAFRRMCRSGICGSCAGVANGEPVLFCQARLGDLAVKGGAPSDADADIALQPLARFRVLKDLVVDMDPFFDALARLEPWLVPNPQFDGVVSKDRMEPLWGAAQCVLCGICASGALASGSGPHPAAVTHVLRFARDPRDAFGAARLDVLGDRRRYDRQFAEALKIVCPKHVDIAKLVSD